MSVNHPRTAERPYALGFAGNVAWNAHFEVSIEFKEAPPRR